MTVDSPEIEVLSMMTRIHNMFFYVIQKEHAMKYCGYYTSISGMVSKGGSKIGGSRDKMQQ